MGHGQEQMNPSGIINAIVNAAVAAGKEGNLRFPERLAVTVFRQRRRSVGAIIIVVGDNAHQV